MAEERIQRRLAAILAADVVGYSRMMGRNEAETLSRLKTLRLELFQPTIKQYGGRIFKTTGDGAFVEFNSAVAAVRSASDIQEALAARNAGLSEDQAILLRIGISLGDVIVEGSDLYGNAVNVASRVEGLAEAGGICVSGNVHEHIGHSLDIIFEDLGEQSVKNIDQPVRCYRVHLASDSGTQEARPVSDAASMFANRSAVAVLPFQNMSGDADQEYFADGLTEDIITALSTWRSFPVIARNSTFAYKGVSPDIRTVGKELGARYVVEGSVRKAGNRVRVTAQLINAETGHHVWAERFDRDIQDIFDLQDEITAKITAVVAPELVKAESERSVTKRPENLDAWDYCQQGKFLMSEISRSGVLAARAAFKQAIELEPNFADAWCGLALTYHRELNIGFSDDTDVVRKKHLEAAQRAVALDDANALAHNQLGLAYMNNGRPAEAVAEGEKAVEVNPMHPQSHSGLGTTLTVAGRPEEGVASLQTCIRLNARYPRIHLYRALLARAHLDARQYEEAADQARQTIRRGRVYLDEHLILASALGHLGRAEEAWATLDLLEEYRGIRISRIEFAHWWRLYRDPGPNEHLFDGLRKAGIPE